MLNLESRVNSRIKYNFSDNIKKKYPDLDFTTSQNNNTKPRFPTVYTELLPSPEIGQTLKGTSLNGVLVTFQIKVSDNVNNSRAREVANEVVRILKTMRFSISEMPYSEFKDSTYYSLIRASRVIGAGDIL
ncbi:MAG: hypothetical protein ACLRZ9_05860 [Eubacterium sp.]